MDDCRHFKPMDRLVPWLRVHVMKTLCHSQTYFFWPAGNSRSKRGCASRDIVVWSFGPVDLEELRIDLNIKILFYISGTVFTHESIWIDMLIVSREADSSPASVVRRSEECVKQKWNWIAAHINFFTAILCESQGHNCK
jgi:hypothetical protein